MRCSMCTTCKVSRRIKGRYTRTRKRYTDLTDLSGTYAHARARSLPLYVYTSESSGLKISAPLKCAGRRLRSRSHGGIERVVSLSWSRPVWTPGRVSTERKGDTRIFVARIARPSITAVSIQGVSDVAQSFPPDTNNVEDEPERIAIAKISERFH